MSKKRMWLADLTFEGLRWRAHWIIDAHPISCQHFASRGHCLTHPSLASSEHDEVVDIANASDAPLVHTCIEFPEHDVARKRGKRAALRNTVRARGKQLPISSTKPILVGELNGESFLDQFNKFYFDSGARQELKNFLPRNFCEKCSNVRSSTILIPGLNSGLEEFQSCIDTSPANASNGSWTRQHGLQKRQIIRILQDIQKCSLNDPVF